jgi:hypothetical protein
MKYIKEYINFSDIDTYHQNCSLTNVNDIKVNDYTINIFNKFGMFEITYGIIKEILNRGETIEIFVEVPTDGNLTDDFDFNYLVSNDNIDFDECIIVKNNNTDVEMVFYMGEKINNYFIDKIINKYYNGKDNIISNIDYIINNYL